MTFRLFKDTATVSRLTTVSGKSAYVAISGVSYKGYLNAINIADIGASRYGKEYRFTTPSTADIIETDQLTIGEQVFKVSEVIANKNIGMVKVKVLSITKVD
jgi:hypothetical protein